MRGRVQSPVPISRIGVEARPCNAAVVGSLPGCWREMIIIQIDARQRTDQVA